MGSIDEFCSHYIQQHVSLFPSKAGENEHSVMNNCLVTRTDTPPKKP